MEPIIIQKVDNRPVDPDTPELKDSELADNENLNASTDDKKVMIEKVKLLENPLCFDCDGVTVRVSFEGTADLNELVKNLFLAG